jgi:hypothetical protein
MPRRMMFTHFSKNGIAFVFRVKQCEKSGFGLKVKALSC